MKHRIVVVSDMHLSEGMQSPREDFFFDLEFSSFIDSLIKEKKLTHLVINGDMIDFLQVTSIGPYRASLTEKVFGYGTQEVKSAWKLNKVFEGHKIFFRALSRFIQAGNKLFILKGNHDIEFFWPKVKGRFLKLMDDIKKTKKHQTNIVFLPWYYYEKDLVYVEHGHQYDEVNSFQNFLYPKLPGRDLLELPFGSFFLRYFFNKIEEDYPYSDNYKPTIEYLKWRFANYKLSNIPVLISYIPFLLRTWWKTKKSFASHKIARVIRNHSRRLSKLDDFAFDLDKLRSPPIMHARDFIKRVFKDHLSYRDRYFNIAKKIKDLTKVKYVVFGHSHVSRRRDFYFNTGTWTPIVGNKGVKDVKKSKRLNYIVIRNGVAELKEWV